jgi:CRISPR/Cas system-associated endonuclease Cas1
MKLLFLDRPGLANIRSSAFGLIIGNDPPVPPPYFDPDTILIGHVGGFVSYAALKELGRWGITLSFLGLSGSPYATFVPIARNDAPLRLAQMRAHLDPEVRLIAARAFIEAKLGERIPDSEGRTLYRLRSYESKKAKERWERLGINRISLYSKSLNAKATSFENASINYAQGILAVRSRTLISKVGLDAGISFMHEPTVNVDSFVFDVQELVRSLGDRIAIVYTREIGADGFRHDEDWVYWFQAGRAKGLAERVVAALNERSHYQGERVSIDGILLRELRRFGTWLRKPRGSFDFELPDKIRKDPT